MPDERPRAVSGGLARAEGPAVRVGVGQEVGVRLAPDRCADCCLAGEPDDPAATPEIASREGDDLAPAGRRAGELERRIVRVRARQPEEDAVEAGWGDVEECFL